MEESETAEQSIRESDKAEKKDSTNKKRRKPEGNYFYITCQFSYSPFKSQKSDEKE